MRGKRVLASLILLLTLTTSARADVVVPGQEAPRNEHSEVFVKLYQSGITPWDSAYDRAFDGVERVVLWKYPGSGEMMSVMEPSAGWFVDEGGRAREMEPCYLDGEGRLWGYVPYAGSVRQAWVCLSDPENESIPAVEEVVTLVDKAVFAMVWQERAPSIFMTIGVVVVTVVLLCVFWRRKKKRGL